MARAEHSVSIITPKPAKQRTLFALLADTLRRRFPPTVAPRELLPPIDATPQPSERPQRLAVLIDADNIPAAVIEGLLATIARFGEPAVKRIYGDFTSPSNAQWKKVLHTFAIKPIQQFAYTTGKNATDSMLIIDAMDLLYTRRFQGFCIVSSDSDFTSLAMRIRDEGLAVYGFGEQKTPESFRNACNTFIFTEPLRSCQSAPAAIKPASGMPQAAHVVPVATPASNGAPAEPVVPAAPKAAKAATPKTTPTAPAAPKLTKADKPAAPNAPKTTKANPTASAPAMPLGPLPSELLREALRQASDASGWANLPAFGSALVRHGFDMRQYGYKKLSDLVRLNPTLFEIEERKAAGASATTLYLRAKP